MRLIPVAALAAGIAWGATPPAWTAALRGEDPHAHFRKPASCPRCHLLIDGKPDPDRFDGDADRFCLECHRGEEPGRSHPRGVRPKDRYRTMKVPEDYRLDDAGRILCLTCHRGHGESLAPVRAFPGQKPEAASGPGGAPAYRTFYVRRSDPERGFAPLCNGCHPSR